MDADGVIQLFAYGSLLPGEAHDSALRGCRCVGSVRTLHGFRLVELQQFPCMVSTGTRQVEGQLFHIDRKKLVELDRLKENGRLFHRRTIELESGEKAQTYLMYEDQVRGRRRLHVDAWKDRFKPRSARTL